MSILKIVKNGDPVLKMIAQELDPAMIKTAKIQQLIFDMVETMYAAKGVGIAAPQIGESLRLFIAESSSGPIALINPIFSNISLKKSNDDEGCLSVPGHFDRVKRSKHVDVEALNMHGDKIKFSADNFFAIVLQHEMDHLNGLLFIDRVEEQKIWKK